MAAHHRASHCRSCTSRTSLTSHGPRQINSQVQYSMLRNDPAVHALLNALLNGSLLIILGGSAPDVDRFIEQLRDFFISSIEVPIRTVCSVSFKQQLAPFSLNHPPSVTANLVTLDAQSLTPEPILDSLRLQSD